MKSIIRFIAKNRKVIIQGIVMIYQNRKYIKNTYISILKKLKLWKE